MSVRLITEYRDQLADAARNLLEIQNPNKGWGLRPGSESSLVNTAEALNVIKAAGLETDPRARAGVAFLIRALKVHYRPQSEDVERPARGLNLRYLSFSADGLVTVPDIAFSDDGIEALKFCIEGLLAARQPGGGLLAKPDGKVVSYHQTARALISMSKLLVTPGVDALPGALLRSARKIADDSAAYLAREQDEDTGAWRAAPIGDMSLSAAKTAISNTGLGYYRLLPEIPDYRERQRRASGWLLANYSKWLSAKSDDPQEAQTSWEHLDYAEVPRGIASGRDGAWPDLERSWKFMLRQWSEPELLWSEPSVGTGNVTVRAAYHTVMAFESALPRTRVTVPPPIGPAPFGALKSVEASSSARGKFVMAGSEGSLVVELSETMDELLRVLLDHPDGISAKDLAANTGKDVRVISGYVGRLNAAIQKATAGVVTKVVVGVASASREKHYKLSMRPGGVQGHSDRGPSPVRKS